MHGKLSQRTYTERLRRSNLAEVTNDDYHVSAPTERKLSGVIDHILPIISGLSLAGRGLCRESYLNRALTYLSHRPLSRKIIQTSV